MKTTDKPLLQDFQIEGVKHISSMDAFEMLKNGEAVLIDVRENDETDLSRIPLENILYHPMTNIIKTLPSISKNQHIILACPGGVRSVKVANLMNLQGYPDVANLDGGLAKWKTQGLPLESIAVSGGCGCGCKPVASTTASCCDTTDEKSSSCCDTKDEKSGGCCC